MRRFKTSNIKVSKVVEDWMEKRTKTKEEIEDIDKAVEKATYEQMMNNQRIINTRSSGKTPYNRFTFPKSVQEDEMMNKEKKDHGFHLEGYSVNTENGTVSYNGDVVFAETSKPSVKLNSSGNWYTEDSPFNSNNNKEMKNNFKIGDKVIMEAKMVNAIGFDCNNKDVEGFVVRSNSREINVFMIRLGTTANVRSEYWCYMKKTVKDKEEIGSTDKELLPSVILPTDERIDEDLLYSANSFDDLGISPEIFIMTLIRYDKALKRAEEIIKKYALV